MDERGDFQAAVSAYRESQKFDTKEERPNATYNLACTLSKWGSPHLQEALAELKKVIDIDDNRRLASQDEDFKNLRLDKELGPEFEALIKKHADA